MQRLPDEAFAAYVNLGPGRSYQAIADEYGVHKRTVVRTAEREEWAARLAAIERKAREAVDEKLAGELQDRKLRQRKLVVAIASRAAKALFDFPLKSGFEGIRAAELAIKLERLLDGEATENTSVDLEAVIRKECAELLSVEETDDEPDPDGVDDED
jgi:hypothetical protein